VPSAASPRAATLQDVALRAGVSRATAARALGGYGAVDATTAARVIGAAEELAYRTNAVARSMITGRTTTLGVVVGDIENEFFSRLVRGCTDVVRAEGYDVLLVNTDEQLARERSAVRVLLERRVDGLLVAPASTHDGRHLREARDAGSPVVLVDRRVRRSGLDSVTVDGVEAARSAVRHLVASGHERIGVLTGDGVRDGAAPEALHPERASISTTTDRLLGYQQALEEAGLAVDPALVRGGHYQVSAARERAVALLRPRTRPTAVFATDSVLALGVLLAMRDLQLRCPEDVSLVTFDDPPWASVVQPRLSVMAQPAYDLGATAARRLLARLRGEEGRARTLTLRATWQPRDSVAPPPRRPRAARPLTAER
jgi:LacI family transcriptional regulator